MPINQSYRRHGRYSALERRLSRLVATVPGRRGQARPDLVNADTLVIEHEPKWRRFSV